MGRARVPAAKAGTRETFLTMTLELTNALAETESLLRQNERRLFLIQEGRARARLTDSPPASVDALAGIVPEMGASSLGSARFRSTFGLTKSYSSGAMAGGIASAEMVSAAARAGGIGFFGAGGLSPDGVKQALFELSSAMRDKIFGCNLLHSSADPELEMATVETCLALGIPALEAAAFLKLAESVVLFRARGLTERPDGGISARHHVFAKISRPEVAARFLQPPPQSMLRELTAAGKMTEREAALAVRLPVATAITAEADSGGHTDQRPLSVLIPLIMAVRDKARADFGWNDEEVPIFVGAAGGLGDPLGFAAAFAMGADFVSTGSLNQSCVEAGTSPMVKAALCRAGMADVAMAPSADMFEAGGRVQVLKRGTMFAQRAQKLFDLWKAHASFEEIPAAERGKIEREILRSSFEDEWEATRTYWLHRRPEVAEAAQQDGKLRMALTFRSYLGHSSRWARMGEAERRNDFQVWCGPAIGAFNKWVEGTWLQAPEARHLEQVVEALMEATASLTRRSVLLALGAVNLPSAHSVARPPDRKMA